MENLCYLYGRQAGQVDHGKNGDAAATLSGEAINNWRVWVVSWEMWLVTFESWLFVYYFADQVLTCLRIRSTSNNIWLDV